MVCSFESINGVKVLSHYIFAQPSLVWFRIISILDQPVEINFSKYLLYKTRLKTEVTKLEKATQACLVVVVAAAISVEQHDTSSSILQSAQT